jgi:hypothetical protein
MAIVRRNNLVDDGQVARAKGFLPETADDRFVLFGHGVTSLLQGFQLILRAILFAGVPGVERWR